MDVNKLLVLDLPVEIIEKFLSFCNYDTISTARLVCRVFNDACQRLLNHGFAKVDKYHGCIQKKIKNKLPRRESERRSHPLAKHVNALSAIETRLSLLNMTYMKYIDMQLSCFIPGKVLDEMFRVLNALADVDTPPRTHELLQELRDISSMAMEHFDEKIVPTLRARIPAYDSAVRCLSVPSVSTSLTPQLSPANDINFHVVPWTSPTQQLTLHRPTPWRQEVNSIKANLRAASTSMLGLKRDVTHWKSTENEQTKKLIDMERTIREQSAIISEQNRKLSEQEQSMRELSTCNVEYENKLTEVYREIAKLRAEVGLEASDNIAKALSARQRHHLHDNGEKEATNKTDQEKQENNDSVAQNPADSIGLPCANARSHDVNNVKKGGKGLKTKKRKTATRDKGATDNEPIDGPVTRTCKKRKV